MAEGSDTSFTFMCYYLPFGRFKMASNGEFIVEDALNILESLTELNGNLRNEVKIFLQR